MHALLWLHFSLVNGGVEIQTPVRLDRNRHGGGVILYVLKTILVLKKKTDTCVCMFLILKLFELRLIMVIGKV